MLKSIDIGEHCVDCYRSVAWRSGLYVNRIPADRQACSKSLHIEGWLCADCQMMECDNCGEMSLDFGGDDNGRIICDDCAEGEARCGDCHSYGERGTTCNNCKRGIYSEEIE